MAVIVVTGAAGLVGSEAVDHWCGRGADVVGIDNDARARFFGSEASTASRRDALLCRYPRRYRHHDVDIRDVGAIEAIFARHGRAISLVVHAAAQPSHDWAAREPRTDFTVNAEGTLNLLEATRRHCPAAPFVFCSTNKVYGDTPNRLPLVERVTRWEIDPAHPYAGGISESMSIDATTHSLFGVSKVAADLLVQEYGRYFGQPTACFRAGCLTGPHHAGAPLHGFLAYLMKCVATGIPYEVHGYKGKQVRDNLHCADLVGAFAAFAAAPRAGAVYNVGGGRYSHCSLLEAIALCEEIAGRELRWSYREANRVGDHIWWVSDTGRFRADYPEWRQEYDLRGLLEAIYVHNAERWVAMAAVGA